MLIMYIFNYLIIMECLDHRSGFEHQIAAAPAACYIAFFSLLRFNYGTLTHEMRIRDSVVASAQSHACLPTRWLGYRFAPDTLGRNSARELFRYIILFFLQNLTIRVRVRAAMPA